MGEHPKGADRLNELDARIKAAREVRQRPKSAAAEKFKHGSLVWRMVTELVVGVLVGGVMGWGLDSLFGTMPLFLIVMGLFGFAAGVRTMLRSAEEIERNTAKGDDPAPQDGPGP